MLIGFLNLKILKNYIWNFAVNEIIQEFLLEKANVSCIVQKLKKSRAPMRTRTTDAQRGNSLHCTAENSIPIPNF